MNRPAPPKKPLSGYLNLHTQTGLMKSYKSKWFIFSSESERLIYFKSSEDMVPQGHITITHASFTFDAKERPGVFDIRADGQVYTLEAKDTSEMIVWLQELQAHRKSLASKRQSVPLGESSRNLKIAAPEEIPPEPANPEDGIPKIVVPEYSAESPNSSDKSNAMKKISQNMSKAADNAKTRISSMFNRKSTVDTCENCQKLAEENYTVQEELRMCKEELDASQQALRMLHHKMNLQLEQISSLQQLTGAYEKPDVAQKLEEEIEVAKLVQVIETQKREYEKLAAHKSSLEAKVDSYTDYKSMTDETLKAKDEIILSLSQQLEGRISGGDPLDTATPHAQSELGQLQNRVEAFELQNKFLNKEILELHSVRLDDESVFSDLSQKHIELEAKFYQLQSKYLVVLNELSQPRIDESDSVTSKASTTKPNRDSLLSSLINEAMEVERDHESVRESLNSSLRMMQYDAYGFSISNEDILDRAASSHTKSEQLVNSIHESPKLKSQRVKWENFLVNVDQRDVQRSQDMKALVREGIPREYREKVWKILINFYVGDFRQKVGSSYYEKLLRKHSKLKNDPYCKQIELDLLRTLPNNKYFENANSEGIPKLRNVLLAYSFHNHTIGYCQGMNRLAAFALLFLSEEDSFWCLVAIVDFIMPPEYFSRTMVAALADQRVLKDVLAEKVPRVYNHLESLEMDISFFSFNWFLTLYIENIPIPTVLRIWDSILFEGCKVLFRFAVAFYKYAEDTILLWTDYITANTRLRELGSTMTDSERISDIAFNELNPFPIRHINRLRATYLDKVKSELRELNALRAEIKNERSHIDYQSEESEEELEPSERSDQSQSGNNASAILVDL